MTGTQMGVRGIWQPAIPSFPHNSITVAMSFSLKYWQHSYLYVSISGHLARSKPSRPHFDLSLRHKPAVVLVGSPEVGRGVCLFGRFDHFHG